MSELVSILIPAYRSARTIRAAITSCCVQTYENIEIIVLNTGTVDHTAEVVKDIKDNRIQLHEYNENKGIAAARNQLLKLAKGTFIAWLDADDKMLPERIATQVAYFKDHPETDILGSWIWTDNEELPSKQLPTSHEDIYHCLWFKNCIIQPAVMSRNFYVNENIFYNEAFANTAEDYELWYRLRDKKRFANLPNYLTYYHMTTGAELEQKRTAGHFQENLDALWQIKWQSVKVQLNEEEKSGFVHFLYNNVSLDQVLARSILKVLKQLQKSNTDGFFHLIIRYHYLRLWRNMRLDGRLMHLPLLIHLREWSNFKKHYLM